jgi:hypothetical protein
MRVIALLAFLLLFANSATARAQAANVDDAFTPGKTVWITDAAGHEEKARILSVSGDTVTANVGDRDTRRFRMSDITRVRARKSDSVLNGALIGAGAAVTSGLVFCRMLESWDVCRSNVGPMMRIGALGAGIGIGVDALIRGRKTIYESGPGSASITALPLIGRRAGGLQFSVGF